MTVVLFIRKSSFTKKKKKKIQEQKKKNPIYFCGITLTLMGALPVLLATRKLMAMSSQFMWSSTQARTLGYISVV